MTVKLNSSGGGSVSLVAPNTGSTRTLTLPDVNGNVVSTGDTGSVATAMLADDAVTPAKLSQPLTRETAKASTSGTTVDFTGIPSWVKRITVMLEGVSTTGSSYILVQIGAGSTTTSGYVGNGSNPGSGTGANFNSLSHTVGFGVSASVLTTGNYSLVGTLVNITGNTWMWSSIGTFDATAALTFGAGKVTLSGTLDRVIIATSTSTTSMAGTNTFDAGTINIMYEG